jgi:hypothetical protein
MEEIIKVNYPALFPEYYQHGEMEYLRRNDELNKDLVPTSKLADLPRRYQSFKNKLPAAIEYLKGELESAHRELAHDEKDSEGMTKQIMEINISERRASKHQKWQAYKNIHKNLIYSNTPENDTLANLLIKARVVQNRLEERRVGKIHSVYYPDTMGERQLAADIFAAHLFEEGVQLPENPYQDVGRKSR